MKLQLTPSIHVLILLNTIFHLTTTRNEAYAYNK
jgi:hypothetical protein